MSVVAYPENGGVTIIYSANTPDYMDIDGVLINPELSEDVKNSPALHLKIVDGVIVVKTEEEIESLDTRTNAEKREQAYKVECDPYLPTLISYNLTSDSRYTDLYNEWKAKRDAILALYPVE